MKKENIFSVHKFDIKRYQNLQKNATSAISSRLDAIKMFNDGKTVSFIADQLGVKENTVNTWLNIYQNEGFFGLVNITSSQSLNPNPQQLRRQNNIEIYLPYSKVQILKAIRDNNIPTTHTINDDVYDLLADLAPTGYNLISDHNIASVYILIGQSNANGGGLNGDNISSNLPQALQGPLYQVYTWNNWTSSFEILQVGVNNRFPTNIPDSRFGTEIRTGIRVRSYRKEPFYLVKYAVGGTSLAPDNRVNPKSDWSPNAGELFDDFSVQYRNAINNLTSLGKIPLLKGVIWIQGEADAQNLNDANAYYNNLYLNADSLFNRLARLTADSYFQFILSGLNNTVPFPYFNKINQAMINTATQSPNIHYISNIGTSLQADNVHYDAEGFKRLSNKIYNLIKDF
ncbi:MAG: sialate O-acetylesterase [Chitinophagales bacterium]|nr:helix-turn-helix domain-containing protein [Bacteroidota bacterium]MCB9042493.1 helix-turn-helix domain-containing protein [Chitinophagales bacterium]